MNKPHKHAELIKVWADGAVIQYKTEEGAWKDVYPYNPVWDIFTEYRIKPEDSDIENYGIEVGDIWLVEKYYLFVSDVYESPYMVDGWCVQFCQQKGKYMTSAKCHLAQIKAKLMFRHKGTVNRLNEI